MLRNREIQILLLFMSLISLAAIIVAAFISPIAAMIVFIASAFLIGSSLLFTRWRYREIEKLSIYLRQISSGNYSLDVRDNQEGELSILKNDIYKVTLMLSEQRSLLQKDKIQLTDAISDISHQLKTPLTSMMVMADLLSDPELSVVKRTEFTRNIRIHRGFAMLSTTELKEKMVIRLCSINPRTTAEELLQIMIKIKALAEEVSASYKHLTYEYVPRSK